MINLSTSWRNKSPDVSSSEDRQLLTRYVQEPNNVADIQKECFINQRVKMKVRLESCSLGRVIVEQLAYLERGTQSLSPYWRGSHDKLNRAVVVLHETLDALEVNADITEALTHALFDPENRPLYDVFAKQRLPWFTPANYPTQTVLKIYFAYVKAELAGLDGSVSRALISRIEKLEQASHTYWPWNYGSQHKLHSILQAVIELKQNQSLNEESLKSVTAKL